MTAVEFLRDKGLLNKDRSQFIIKFDDGREFELTNLLDEYLDKRVEDNTDICGRCSYATIYPDLDGKLKE